MLFKVVSVEIKKFSKTFVIWIFRPNSFKRFAISWVSNSTENVSLLPRLFYNEKLLLVNTNYFPNNKRKRTRVSRSIRKISKKFFLLYLFYLFCHDFFFFFAMIRLFYFFILIYTALQFLIDNHRVFEFYHFFVILSVLIDWVWFCFDWVPNTTLFSWCYSVKSAAHAQISSIYARKKKMWSHVLIFISTKL